MKQINEHEISSYLSSVEGRQMEPVLVPTNDGLWTMFFQTCEVGFPFREFHTSVINSNGVQSKPLLDWVNVLNGVECVKLDLRSYSAKSLAPSPDLKLTCQSCELTSGRADFSPARDLLLRIEPGESFTDSECPECGALAHPDEKDFPEGWHIMEMFLRKIDEYQANLGRDEANYDLAKLAMSLALMHPDQAVVYAKEVLSHSQE
jgi:hypothetical protein